MNRILALSLAVTSALAVACTDDDDGLLGGSCVPSRAAPCTEGTAPECVNTGNDCGLAPPGLGGGCKDNECVECAGDDVDPRCSTFEPGLAGERCDAFEGVCAEGLFCIEERAYEGGRCTALPDGCDPENACGCAGWTDVCGGSPRTSCSGDTIACTGLY